MYYVLLKCGDFLCLRSLVAVGCVRWLLGHVWFLMCVKNSAPCGQERVNSWLTITAYRKLLWLKIWKLISTGADKCTWAHKCTHSFAQKRKNIEIFSAQIFCIRHGETYVKVYTRMASFECYRSFMRFVGTHLYPSQLWW